MSSEQKRVVFTTINDTNKQSSGAQNGKTLRLELNLFEPNTDSFPEFNYSKLLEIEKVIFIIN